MNDAQSSTVNTPPKKPRGCMRLLGTLAIVCTVIIIIIAGWVKYNIYASPLRPTTLTAQEEKLLDSKLTVLTGSDNLREEFRDSTISEASDGLAPAPYTEAGARREISLTEKELNGLIAHNPEMARKVAIDLSEGLVSIQMIIPVDDQVFLFGGKTIRIHMGILLGFEQNRPVVSLKGVSLGGIPLPNAWLGYLKGKNLVEEFGSKEGFWQLFSEGVRDITVKEGHILIALKE